MASSGNGGGNRVSSDVGGVGVRSAAEKEKTKMRERQRRSITTKIFHGLRKHGGYRLSPRADINEVLRHLAREAGWVVDADGTTYRSPAPLLAPNPCPLCGGAGKRSRTPTPTSSVINVSGGGDSSTASLFYSGAWSECDNPLAEYMQGSIGLPQSQDAASGGGAFPAAYDGKQRPLVYLQEARASNQNTPVGSPRNGP
ncbi:protein BZR1 homolog 2-like [Diospyros lotus]|uniref:protein BZR1 homolog 2-like n=1 Tax=Diospyros lotus TaxID=55363 RepID=UPI00225BCFDB|nr:protein BZR1 homolog 2-like [Diospyros lotus]